MPDSAPPARDRRGIVDEVFALRHPGARRRWEIAALVVAGAFSGVFVGLPRLARPSRADRAVAAPVAPDRQPEMTIELPPPRPQPRPAPLPVAATPVPRPAPPSRRTAVPAPALAAPVARVPDAQPLDFAASTFVSGKATAYAVGASASAGTSSHTVGGGALAPIAGGPGSRRRAVSLDESAWSCPWPSEAEGAETAQATVVLRVSVRSNGAADEVKILSDPGLGFGPAARACALRTHFRPALDDSGAAVSAWSPPIRVRFVR